MRKNVVENDVIMKFDLTELDLLIMPVLSFFKSLVAAFFRQCLLTNGRLLVSAQLTNSRYSSER